MKGENKRGANAGNPMETTAQFCQLTTPRPSGGPAGTGAGGGCRAGWNSPRSEMAGWITPDAYNDPKSGGSKPGQPSYEKSLKQLHLHHQSQMAGYPTPRADSSTEDTGTKKPSGWHKAQNLHSTAHQFALPDMTGWALNPTFSLCFLMGYPLYWVLAGIKAMTQPKRR